MINASKIDNFLWKAIKLNTNTQRSKELIFVSKGNAEL
jgi:hypothetical protein